MLRISIKNNKKQIVRRLLLTISIVAGLAAVPLAYSQPAFAASDCSNTDTCNGCPKAGSTTNKGQGTNCFINSYINPAINVLSIAIGLVVTIGVITGGIQYATSADDPGKVSKAKAKIATSIVALLAFIFLRAFLNYVLPGGVG